MKRSMILIVLMLAMIFTATPVFAGPLTGILIWIAETTGATEAVVDWSVGGILAIFAAWVFKKIPNDKVAWPFEKFFYVLGVTVTLGLAKWTYTESWWNKHGEPWVVDLIRNIVGASVDAFIAGMESDNK